VAKSTTVSVEEAEAETEALTTHAGQPLRTWRLDQLLLLGTVLLVVSGVALSGLVQAWSAWQEFSAAAQVQTRRLEAQAHEIGGVVSRLLAITSISPLLDQNDGVLRQLTRAVVGDNPNLLRVQILDAEGRRVADTAVDTSPPAARRAERSRSPSTFAGHPAFEYQEPIAYLKDGPPGLVVVTYSLEPLQAQLRLLEESKRATLRSITLRSVVGGGFFVVLAGLLAGFQGRRITRPLGRLSTEAMRLAQGDLSARVDRTPGAGREVETLGIVFNHLADRINDLLEDVRVRAKLEREVDLARTVQQTLLPGPEPFIQGSLRVAGAISPAEFVAGDWWLRVLVGDRVVVGVGDVAGHGLSTALIASTVVSGFVTSLRGRTVQNLRAVSLLQMLNQTLFVAGKGAHQMSAALAVFDLENWEVDCVSAGHPSPCLYDRNDGHVSWIAARGPGLGKQDHIELAATRLRFRPGSLFVWFTDGLTQAKNPSGQAFGEEALASAVKRHAKQPAERLRDLLLSDVSQHTGGIPSDDVTVVVAEATALPSQQLG
jgi:sigma-B regulation protein RsbU (phosphoserine phosphatase)